MVSITGLPILWRASREAFDSGYAWMFVKLSISALRARGDPLSGANWFTPGQVWPWPEITRVQVPFLTFNMSLSANEQRSASETQSLKNGFSIVHGMKWGVHLQQSCGTCGSSLRNADSSVRCLPPSWFCWNFAAWRNSLSFSHTVHMNSMLSFRESVWETNQLWIINLQYYSFNKLWYITK